MGFLLESSFLLDTISEICSFATHKLIETNEKKC